MFKGKRVLVTGGTSGIGLAIAEAFFAVGARVAVCGRDAKRLRSVEARLPGVLTITCDVCNQMDVDAMIETIRREFGRLDIVVSNAGRLTERDFAATTVDADPLRQELKLNFTAPVLLTAKCLPLLSGSLPTIIMITSGYALVPPTRSPTYGAAKAGLHGFIGGLRRQLRGKVRVVEVLPPTVDTPATVHRKVKKVPASAVATALLDGLRQGRNEIYIGQTRLLPVMLRLAPGWINKVVSAS